MAREVTDDDLLDVFFTGVASGMTTVLFNSGVPLERAGALARFHYTTVVDDPADRSVALDLIHATLDRRPFDTVRLPMAPPPHG